MEFYMKGKQINIRYSDEDLKALRESIEYVKNLDFSAKNNKNKNQPKSRKVA